MARYQNQSKSRVVAGRGAVFAPGEIKEGDYQRLADAGVLVRLPDAPVPAPVPARKPAPVRKPEPTPERKPEPPFAPSVIKAVESKPVPDEIPEEKMLSVDPPENISITNRIKDEDEPAPEPEQKSSPRASRSKKKKKTRR